MTQEQIQLLILKGLVAEMPPEAQAKVSDAKARISDVLQEFGDTGAIALALTAIEFQVADGGK